MAVCLRKGEVEAKKKKRGGNETVVGNEYGGRELRPSRLIISKKDSYVSKKCFLIRNTHSITRHILRLIELNCPPTPCQILSLSPPTCPWNPHISPFPETHPDHPLLISCPLRSLKLAHWSVSGPTDHSLTSCHNFHFGGRTRPRQIYLAGNPSVFDPMGFRKLCFSTFGWFQKNIPLDSFPVSVTIKFQLGFLFSRSVIVVLSNNLDDPSSFLVPFVSSSLKNSTY